jgi:hypothetical protein
MGMFDNIKYCNEEYQTKDTPAQLCDNYKIDDNQLWYEEYDSEWEDGAGLFGGGIRKFNERWVLCNEFDGLIRFYREDQSRGGYKADAWIEYQALFMNGNMIKLTQTRGVEPLTAWYKSGVEALELTPHESNTTKGTV